MADLAARPTPRVGTLFPPVALAEQGRRAGVVTRTFVMAIDAAVVAAALGATYLLWAAGVFMVGPDPFSWPHLPAVGGLGLAYIICVLYLTWGWASTGRSVGKQLFGLRVVTRRGHKLGPVLAFIRANACAFFPVLLFWCAISRRNRSVQDILLRTSVIYDWQSWTPDARPASSRDALGAAVDVAAPVTHEPDDGHAEALPRLDGE